MYVYNRGLDPYNFVRYDTNAWGSFTKLSTLLRYRIQDAVGTSYGNGFRTSIPIDVSQYTKMYVRWTRIKNKGTQSQCRVMLTPEPGHVFNNNFITNMSGLNNEISMCNIPLLSVRQYVVVNVYALQGDDTLLEIDSIWFE